MFHLFRKSSIEGLIKIGTKMLGRTSGGADGRKGRFIRKELLPPVCGHWYPGWGSRYTVSPGRSSLDSQETPPVFLEKSYACIPPNSHSQTCQGVEKIAKWCHEQAARKAQNVDNS